MPLPSVRRREEDVSATLEIYILVVVLLGVTVWLVPYVVFILPELPLPEYRAFWRDANDLGLSTLLALRLLFGGVLALSAAWAWALWRRGKLTATTLVGYASTSALAGAWLWSLAVLEEGPLNDSWYREALKNDDVSWGPLTLGRVLHTAPCVQCTGRKTEVLFIELETTDIVRIETSTNIGFDRPVVVIEEGIFPFSGQRVRRVRIHEGLHDQLIFERMHFRSTSAR